MTAVDLTPSGRRVTAFANGRAHSLLHYPGAGPTVYLVPGISSTAATLDFVASRVSPRYDVYAADVRGRGRSDRARPGDYGLAACASDVVALIAALELDDPVLVGHSYGARVVAAAAAQGARARAVIAVDPPMSGPDRAYPTTRESFERQLAEARAGTTTEAVRALYPRWPERELAMRAAELPTCDPVAVLETHAGFHAERFEPLWDAVTAPAALIVGATSRVVLAADVDALRAVHPDRPVFVVPDAGHMVPWDNVTGFLAALDGALDAVLERPAGDPGAA